jgi:hypothetical protein
MSDYIPPHYYTKYMHFWDDADHVARLLPPPLCTPSEMAGMFDGDGSMFLNGQKQVKCELTQCYYPLLAGLQKCFGGIITKRSTKNRSIKHRYQYTLTFSGLEIAAIVPFIKDHLVLKVARAERSVKVLSFYNKTDEDSAARREALLKDKTDVYAFDRINKDYIRGIFCAEGCLRHDGISIAQKSCRELLYEIQKHIGAQLGRGPNFGTVTATSWAVYKKADIKLVLDWLTDNNTRRLFYEEKAGQVDAWYAWYDTGDKEYIEEISRIKHEDYDIPKGDLEEGNKVAKQFSARLRSEATGREVRPTAAPAPPLTDAQRQTARDLLKTSNASLRDIATEVKCTKEQVQHLQKTENIARPEPKDVPEQLTPQQQIQVKTLLFSKDKELSYQTIANMVKCNRGQVATYAALVKAPARTPVRKPKASGGEAVTEKPPKPATGEKRKLAPRLNDNQKKKLWCLLENPVEVDPDDPAKTKTLTQKEIAERVECTPAQVAQHKKKWFKKNEAGAKNEAGPSSSS